MTTDAPYRFSVWPFTDRDIDVITDMVVAWADGAWTPVDQRTTLRAVLEWARTRHLIYRVHAKNDTSIYRDYDVPQTRRWEKPGRYHMAGGALFDVAHDLPVEALWRLVDTYVLTPNGEALGFSLAKSRGWLKMNLWPYGHTTHGDRDLTTMSEILLRLTQYHYIIWQAAGQVWQVTRLPQNEWIRTETT